MTGPDMVEELYCGEAPACYMSVMMPEQVPECFMPGTMYFVKASMLPPKLIIQDVAFVVEQDCSCDFSAIPGEYILLRKHVVLKTLFAKVQDLVSQKAGEGYALEEILINLFQEKGVKEILDLGSDILQNPLVLFVSEGKKTMMLHSYIENTAGVLSPPFYEKRSPENIKRNEMHFRDTERMLAAGCPVMFEGGANFSEERRIGTLVRSHNGELFGGLALYEKENELKEQDFICVDILSRILGEKIKTPGALLNHRGIPEQMLLDLLKGRTDNIDREWLRNIDGNRHQRFQILVLDLSELDHTARGQLETFFAMEVRCLTARKTPKLIVLINPKNRNDEKALIDKALKLIEGKNITGGLSEPFENIENASIYYRQAVKAAAIPLPNHRKDRIRRYAELKYYILLNEVRADTNLTAFISDDYMRLKRSDQEKGTEYCKTLVAMILSNTNRKEVCAQLHIHRNTLPQRIGKIEELLGRPITDTDFLFDIYFSYIIDTYRNISR